MAVVIVCLWLGYHFYGRWLEKTWGIDPIAKTPAALRNDGKDYQPASRLSVFAHQFTSITGAGPVTGPIIAAMFGWLPALLWIIIGGIFFGAVQDFTALYASVRNGGKSMGMIIEQYVGRFGRQLFLAFCWLFTLLVIAAFADMIAATFNGFTKTGEQNMPNAAAASISMIYIVGAVIFGLFQKYVKPSSGLQLAVGITMMIAMLAMGIAWPIYADADTWRVVVFLYAFAASVMPMWILKQPRDFLSMFLLFGMIIAGVVGVFVTNPTINMPAFVGWEVKGLDLFPILFVTIACGAISGFHSLVSSGTSSKMIANETDMRPVGYGAMLMEGFVAIMALVAACVLVPADYFAINAPADKFAKLGMSVVDLPTLEKEVAESLMHRPGGSVSLAVGMAHIFGQIPWMSHLMSYWYHFAIMFEAVFILTAVDAGTRVGRFFLQEMIGKVIPKFADKEWVPGVIITSVLFTGSWGYLVYSGDIGSIWPLFGICNQLLASVTLLIGTTVILRMNKAKYAWITGVPGLFMTVITFWAGIWLIVNQYLPGGKILLATLSVIVMLLMLFVIYGTLRRWFALLAIHTTTKDEYGEDVKVVVQE